MTHEDKASFKSSPNLYHYLTISDCGCMCMCMCMCSCMCKCHSAHLTELCRTNQWVMSPIRIALEASTSRLLKITGLFCIWQFLPATHIWEFLPATFQITGVLCKGWRKPIGCLFCIFYFPQKSPTVSGSFVEKGLQLKTSYASLSPCRGHQGNPWTREILESPLSTKCTG